jgi:hypothetical protein
MAAIPRGLASELQRGRGGEAPSCAAKGEIAGEAAPRSVTFFGDDK